MSTPQTTKRRVLVTGGAGYIGSHATKRLLEAGHDVLVVDNLFRGHVEAIDRIRTLPEASAQFLGFHRHDVGETDALADLMAEHRIDSVMHFAALAYVGESVTDPLAYYKANTSATIGLLEACARAGVSRFIFSSTCATYGEPAPENIPIVEATPQNPINPYGASKLFIERVLADFAQAQRLAGKEFAHACLRYFNVAGADPDGLIGEHHEPETHLLPIILEVALGKRDHIIIFGNDYDTPDGTCIRDYVHVQDLVDAHIRTLDALKDGDQRRYNIGIGKGYSVLEVIKACRDVTNHPIPVKNGERRPGDPATLFADSSALKHDLDWSAEFVELHRIIETAWQWHRRHPDGYEPCDGA